LPTKKKGRKKGQRKLKKWETHSTATSKKVQQQACAAVYEITLVGRGKISDADGQSQTNEDKDAGTAKRDS